MRRAATAVPAGVLAGVLAVVLPAATLGASSSEVEVPATESLTLPDDFELVDYPTGQAPYNLTNFAWLDDGGLLTSGKDGTITFVPPGGDPRQVGTVPDVRAIGDHGLLGFAPANDYSSSGRVFVSYDKGDPEGTGFGMVEEWKAAPAEDPTSFTHVRTIIDGSAMQPQLTQTGTTHAIDTLVVAPDDTLYLSIGDNALNNGDPNTLRAQDLRQPFGKLLHLTVDGKGLPTNPFYSAERPGSWRSMVYAYGFRNPFRFSLDPRSGTPYLGDVGWGSREEVDTVPSGANAGWPCYEGLRRTTFSTTAVCTALYAEGSALMPIWTYGRDHSHASVVGGIHYTGTSYPEEYHGAYFFGDYSKGRLWTLTTDSAGVLTREPEPDGFALDAGGPVAFQTGPNGDLTYADILTGQVRRLVHTEGNRAPTADIAWTTDADTRTVSFTAAGSSDLDGDTLSYEWDLGDGTSAEGVAVEHTYASADPVDVTLTVRDQPGADTSTTVAVHPANHTPQLEVTVPATTYAVGDAVELAATATDAEDGELTVTWETALRHCPFPLTCHLHPDGATEEGPTYARDFPDHGGDTTMLVTARVTDSTGATTAETYEALPRLHTLAVTSPVAVQINGVVAASASVVAGSSVQLLAPAVSGPWTLLGWSDGGAPAHSLTMPDEDVTLSVSYRSAIAERYAQLGGRSSFLGAPTSSEYDVPGGRARNYAGGRLYWSAAHGVHELHGPVLAKYLEEGGPAEVGLPRTDTRRLSPGARVHLTGGRSIFWSRATAAHLVRGAIRDKYAAMGYQRSCLGFPVSDEQAVPGGRRSRFQGGTITYQRDTGTVKAHCG